MPHERIEPEFLLWELLDVPGRGGRRQLIDRRRGGEVPDEGSVRHAITSGAMGTGKRFRAEWKDRVTGRMLTAATIYAPMASMETAASTTTSGSRSLALASPDPMGVSSARRIEQLERENELLRAQISGLDLAKRTALEERDRSHRLEIEQLTCLREAEVESVRRDAASRQLLHESEIARVEFTASMLASERDALRRHCKDLTHAFGEVCEQMKVARGAGSTAALGAGAVGVVAGALGAIAVKHVLERDAGESAASDVPATGVPESGTSS